ncbi:hypothetical protein C7B67_01910 [filamentous cyanobacterium Phorm 6]|nr:hypothetical protein C7B67_01910 [filamentous cyanobacterium Phorm 6]
MCKLQIEVFAVFGLISNKKLIKTQIYANLCKVESLHKKQRWTVASNVFVITNLTFKCGKKNNPPINTAS